MNQELKYVDMHTHVNINAFKDDWEEVSQRALEDGVWFINVGTQQDTSKKAVEIAEHFPDGVYATIGLHPIHTSATYHDEQELGEEHKGFTSRGEDFDAIFYRELARSEKVVAIGECGFDYFRCDTDALDKQREAFLKQIELANELEKPLMLHVRAGEEGDAYKDAYEMVREHAHVSGNVHFFAGSVEEAKRFWNIGFSTSFTGVITFTSDYDEVVKAAPKELIHGETDAPYVTPVPNRGKRNEPVNVQAVYRRLAELRGVDEEEMREQLVQNARTLFKI